MMWNEIKGILEYPILELNQFRLTFYSIIIFVLIIIGSRLLARFLKVVIRKFFAARQIDEPGKEYALAKITSYFVITIGIIVAVDSLGIDITYLLASSAALFVGIGLGLQNIFSDFVSGFVLIFEGELRKGDIIEFGQTVGRIEQIDIRTSKIKTRDNMVIVVPNSRLVTNELINWSHSSKLTRFRIDVGVAYGSDTQLVKKLLIECAREHEAVSTLEPILVRFEHFGDFDLQFSLSFWAERSWEIEIIKSEIRFRIDEMFRKNNVRIPFPQTDVYVNPNHDNQP